MTVTFCFRASTQDKCIALLDSDMMLASGSQLTQNRIQIKVAYANLTLAGDHISELFALIYIL